MLMLVAAILVGANVWPNKLKYLGLVYHSGYAHESLTMAKNVNRIGWPIVVTIPTNMSRNSLQQHAYSAKVFLVMTMNLILCTALVFCIGLVLAKTVSKPQESVG